MSDLTTEQRLAALQARSRTSTAATQRATDCPQSNTAEQTVVIKTEPLLTDHGPAPASARAFRDEPLITIPWNRVAATGASIVSFASMVVAMGPIFQTLQVTEAGADSADGAINSESADGGIIPTAPAVDIQPAVNQPLVVDAGVLALADPTATPLDGAPAAVVPDPTAAPQGSVRAPAPDQPTTPDTTAEAPPSTEPTTQPPATAPPSTPPPKSGGSGG